ncbi:MAG TPA: ABC transporter permease [Candidatus Coproplasma excrementavium]|nr:ABC transporter permease [Candidatus Coproplasma excrementavium]
MSKKTGSLSQRMYLLRLLVKRNIKNQYYRSFIGVVWTVLNPLLNMIVMAFVFSALFGRHTDGLDYPIYILSGNIIFGIMRGSTSSSLGCLVGQADMLQKTRVPIEIFPTANVFSALVTFGFSFIALLLVAGFRALPILGGPHFIFPWQIVLVIIILPAVTIFSLGISYFLSALFVFFRDIKHIYSVILTLWTYLTPLFYSVDALNSELVSKAMVFNPMYHYVEGFRELLRGDIPNIMLSFSTTQPSILAMYGFAAISLVIGWLFLEAMKNKIAANL